MSLRTLAVGLVASAVAVVCAAACSGSESPAPVNELAVPRFETASGEFADLIGTTFTADSLPAQLGGGIADALTGSTIINVETDPGDDSVAMHWFREGDHMNMALSDLVAGAGATPEWSVVDAYRLVLDPDTVVTVGTTVCAAPIHTYDWQNGEFIAVVNADQNMAFGAWTITRNGPTPYGELDTLTCERFVPY